MARSREALDARAGDGLAETIHDLGAPQKLAEALSGATRTVFAVTDR